MKRKIKSVYFQMGVGLTAVMTALTDMQDLPMSS